MDRIIIEKENGERYEYKSELYMGVVYEPGKNGDTIHEHLQGVIVGGISDIKPLIKMLGSTQHMIMRTMDVIQNAIENAGIHTITAEELIAMETARRNWRRRRHAE